MDKYELVATRISNDTDGSTPDIAAILRESFPQADGEAKALSESCEALIKKWDSEMGREDWAPNFAEELREALTREAPKDESAEENN